MQCGKSTRKHYTSHYGGKDCGTSVPLVNTSSGAVSYTHLTLPTIA